MNIDLENPRPIDIAAARALKSRLDSWLKKHEVAYGVPHKIGGMQLCATFPDFAVVTRAAGDNKDGTNDGPIPRLSISETTLKLLIHRAGLDCSESFWESVIRETLQGMTVDLPKAALIGLATVQAEVDKLTPQKPPKINTPAQSTGQKEIVLELLGKSRTKPAKKKAAA